MMWRSLTGTEENDLRSFTRLEDGQGPTQWGTNATVHGGKRKAVHGEPHEIILEDIPLPEGGIMVKTEVTLISSERIDYQDRLF